MQSSGYFFVASKLAGLISTPSMVAPSLLFQETTSRVPSVSDFVCSVMFVSPRGENRSTLETKTSFRDVGELAVNASCFPSRDNEKNQPLDCPDPRRASPCRSQHQRGKAATPFLLPGEVDAIRPPFKEIRVLIEAVGDRSWRPAGRGHDGQTRVAGKVNRCRPLLTQRRSACHPATNAARYRVPAGRPTW